MGAIFGLINLDGAPAAVAELRRMEQALAEYGTAPTEGCWWHGAGGAGVRLHRFTPQDAWERQPLVGQNGAWAVVADARLDNRRELLADLAIPLDEAVVPDSLLIQRAYDRWGEECPRHLRGVFAFAVVDSRGPSVFAARSPICAPDLVFADLGKRFAFATMPSGLHALSFLSRELNESRLAGMLASCGGDPTATIYRNIGRLRTGHVLTASAQGVRTACYWRPDLHQTLSLDGDDAYYEAFTSLWTRVVEDHLRSAGEVGLQLSGGLDSSAVAATACGSGFLPGGKLAAFTDVPMELPAFPLPVGRYADETPLVRAMTRQWPNLEANFVQTGHRMFLDGLERTFAFHQQPFRNTSNRMWIEEIFAAAARRNIRVLLDGMQGNITLSWNGGGRLAPLLLAGRFSTAWRQASAAAPGLGETPWRLLLRGGIVPLLPDAVWVAGRRFQRWRRWPEQPVREATGSVIHPDFAREQGLTDSFRRQALLFRPWGDSRETRYHALANQDFGPILSGYRAMFGVDGRSPAADARLAEFCLALPEEQFIRAGETRRLLRRAMAGRLPPEVTGNRQRGLQAANWLNSLQQNRGRVAATLEALAENELVRRMLDLRRLQLLCERIPGGKTALPAGGERDFVTLQYGIMMGVFLRWFDAGGRR